MTQPTRRIFIVRSCAFAAFAAPVLSRAATHVEETDETAAALGYRHDTRQVDQKKYPNHTPQQDCKDCSFFQGTPADAWAGCAMFGRKQIAAGGWCTAWAKKPG